MSYSTAMPVSLVDDVMRQQMQPYSYPEKYTTPPWGYRDYPMVERLKDVNGNGGNGNSELIQIKYILIVIAILLLILIFKRV